MRLLLHPSGRAAQLSLSVSGRERCRLVPQPFPSTGNEPHPWRRKPALWAQPGHFPPALGQKGSD